MAKHRRKSVCLFGLSADPPTSDGGHGGIVKALVEDEQSFDEVRVLPVYQHTFSQKRGRMASFQDRISMCRLAFEGIPKVHVSEAEKTCFEKAAEGLNDQQLTDLRVGTADLLEMLMSQEPNSDFTFALGADTFMDLTSFKWKRSRDVLLLLQGRLVIISRVMDETSQQVCNDALNERVAMVNAEYGENAKIQFIPTLEAVSSSLARSCSDECLQRYVKPNVLLYIKQNRLYGLSNSDAT